MPKLRRMRVLLVITSLVLTIGGCTEIKCGEGTHLEGATCVPNIPLKCGPGTKREQGWCVAPDAGSLLGDDADAEDRDTTDI